jgi:hypothetical protein
MKKILLLLTIISFSSIITAQVKVNQNAANSAINTSSAFMDASSSPLWNGTTNQGKGMLYPRVDLVNYTAMSHAGPFNASNNPNYFDGLLVFNTATGVAGIGADSVFPGYYYYRNTTTTANGGHWVSLKGIKGDDGTVGPVGPQGVQGIDGKNALIKTTAEPTGSNCAVGGTKIETGIDANSNGILEISEVDNTQTTYVCGSSTGTGVGYGFSNMQVYATAGTYTFTVPVGVTKVMVEVWGAGGGGNYGSSGGGRPGGGGGYGKSIFIVNAGTVYSVVVGAGGASGTSTSFPAGATGGSSSFGVIITSTGGRGGDPLVNTYLSGLGGTGNGSINQNGGKGNDGQTGTTFPPIGGNGALGGSGGQPNNSCTGGIQHGSAPGGGGAGYYGTSCSQGNGAQGRVIVWW